MSRFRISKSDEEVIKRLKELAFKAAEHLDQEERAEFLVNLGYAIGLSIKIEQEFEQYFNAVEGALA